MLADGWFFGGVFADLAAEVDGVVMDDDSAHALFGLLALDHGEVVLGLCIELGFSEC